MARAGLNKVVTLHNNNNLDIALREVLTIKGVVITAGSIYDAGKLFTIIQGSLGDIPAGAARAGLTSLVGRHNNRSKTMNAAAASAAATAASLPSTVAGALAMLRAGGKPARPGAPRA